MAYITLLFYDHLEYRLLYFLVYFCFKPILYFFFFFQAEDGIRDFHVTGVQTCCSSDLVAVLRSWTAEHHLVVLRGFLPLEGEDLPSRSEERRVGKECRCWWWASH